MENYLAILVCFRRQPIIVFIFMCMLPSYWEALAKRLQ